MNDFEKFKSVKNKLNGDDLEVFNKISSQIENKSFYFREEEIFKIREFIKMEFISIYLNGLNDDFSNYSIFFRR